jgi:hypothetical protein
MRILIKRAVTINLTGYDREPVTYQPGEHEVPSEGVAHVAAWLAVNPDIGRVIAGAPAQAAADGAAESGEKPADGGDTPEDLSALTVPVLRDRAIAAGVDGAKGMNKAALIAALRE